MSILLSIQTELEWNVVGVAYTWIFPVTSSKWLHSCSQLCPTSTLFVQFKRPSAMPKKLRRFWPSQKIGTFLQSHSQFLQLCSLQFIASQDGIQFESDLYSSNKIWIGTKIGPVVSILAAQVDQWIPNFKITMSGKDTAVGVHWSNSETTFKQNSNLPLSV